MTTCANCGLEIRKLKPIEGKALKSMGFGGYYAHVAKGRIGCTHPQPKVE